MLDMRDRLIEQMRHVIVVQVVHDVTSIAPTDDEAEVTQDPQLVGYRRRFHPDGLGQLSDGLRATAEPTEDAHPAPRRQGLHGVGDRGGEVSIEALDVAQLAMAHGP
jgi:hypothetical protein